MPEPAPLQSKTSGSGLSSSGLLVGLVLADVAVVILLVAVLLDLCLKALQFERESIAACSSAAHLANSALRKPPVASMEHMTIKAMPLKSDGALEIRTLRLPAGGIVDLKRGGATGSRSRKAGRC